MSLVWHANGGQHESSSENCSVLTPNDVSCVPGLRRSWFSKVLALVLGAEMSPCSTFESRLEESTDETFYTFRYALTILLIPSDLFQTVETIIPLISLNTLR